MKACGFNGASLGELKNSINQAIAAKNLKPNLAIVFGSVSHNLGEVGHIFKDLDIEVFGASSAGEILEIGEGDCVYQDSIVGLLLELDKSYYQMRLFKAQDQSSYEVGQAAGDWAKQTFASPALLVLVSGMQSDGEQIVKGIIEKVGNEAPLYGGLAGDDNKFKETFVFNQEQVSNNGVLALVFDHTKVDIQGVAASGWQSVGVEKTVTKSVGNVVYTIDGQPALDHYKQYLGVGDNSENLLVEYPLQILKDGYTVLRSPLTADVETKALTFAGTVPQGSKVRFSSTPGFEIVDFALDEMRKFHKKTDSAEALLLFSCIARHLALGPMAEDEIQPMQQLWDAPLAGFFTYGEIGHNIAGKCDFHNETCVLVTINEK